MYSINPELGQLLDMSNSIYVSPNCGKTQYRQCRAFEREYYDRPDSFIMIMKSALDQKYGIGKWHPMTLLLTPDLGGPQDGFGSTYLGMFITRYISKPPARGTTKTIATVVQTISDIASAWATKYMLQSPLGCRTSAEAVNR